jgi:prevent-host-death family protein
MGRQEPITQTMKISNVKNRLSSLVNEVYRGERRILVEKSGIPVAALVSADDLNRLQQLDREWDKTTKAIERFSQAFADVPVPELEAKIDEIIAEGRAKDAAARRTA